MSYYRGDPYVWRDDGDNLHIWTSRGAARNEERKYSVILEKDLFDMMCVARTAELIEEGRIHEVIARGKNMGNGGFISLHNGWLFGKRKTT